MLRGIGPFVRLMLLVALGAALVAAGANAQPAATPVTVASGLDNPRGLEIGRGGAVYVAEAGSGGGTCFGTGMNRICLGFTGAVTRIARGSQQRIATGFLSAAGPDGSFATGPDDVAVTNNGTVYVIETSAPPEALRGLPAAIRRQAGRLFRLRPGGGWTAVANVGRLEQRINPDGREVNPNPYGVVAGPAGVFSVVDAGGNTLPRVDRSGQVSLLAVLPPQTVGGKQVQSVPTTVTVGPDGALYVGELGGEGTPRGRSRIFRIDPFADEDEGEEEIEVFATGFSAISGIDFGPNGALYVAEQFGPGESLVGAVVKVAPNGRRSVLARLPAPGGVAVAPNGAVYVSVNSVFAGIGSVVRLRG